MFELHKDEKVILYIRKHWIFITANTFSIFLLFILPVALVWAAQVWGLVPDISLLGVSIFAVSDILIYLWGLFCWMLLAEKFTDYALDFWVVTNKRIIESELVKLFDVQLSTLELEDIEDITVRSEGFWANVFGYGKLEVQTAGATNEFFAEQIMDPAKVQKIIFDAKLAYRQEEKDIEKGEMEQISKRVFAESEVKEDGNKQIETVSKETEYDWAHINQKQKSDLRNVEEEIDFVEDMYKVNVDKALQAKE